MDEWLEGFNEWMHDKVSDKTRKDYIYWLGKACETGQLTKSALLSYYETKPLPTVKASIKLYAEYNKWKIDLPKTRSKRSSKQPKYYEAETALELIEKMPRRYRLITKLMYESGLRVSEATNIKIEDIKKSEGRILVIGKGDKERSAYPSTELIQELIDHYNAFPPARKLGYIFSSPKKIGYPVNTKTVRHHLRKCGILGAIPHKFRHTFAINMLKDGENLPTISKTLGHTNINTTSIYTSVFDAEVKEASERYRLKRKNPPLHSGKDFIV